MAKSKIIPNPKAVNMEPTRTERQVSCVRCKHRFGVSKVALMRLNEPIICPCCKQEAFIAKLDEGTKHDQGKMRWDLLPAESVEQVIEILMFGAEKYEPYNWAKGIKYSRVFAACMRHLWAWWRGETVDPESGKNHLAHACCCLFFLLSYSVRNMKQLDDRPGYYKKET